MAGLIKENFQEEVITELMWIMSAIDDISSKIGIETYEIALIKYRIQPEEEQAISKFLRLHIKELESLAINDIQSIISKYFFKITQKKWSLDDDVL